MIAGEEAPPWSRLVRKTAAGAVLPGQAQVVSDAAPGQSEQRYLKFALAAERLHATGPGSVMYRQSGRWPEMRLVGNHC